MSPSEANYEKILAHYPDSRRRKGDSRSFYGVEPGDSQKAFDAATKARQAPR